MKLSFIPLAVILSLVLFSQPALAQYEISGSAGLEIPMGNLTWVYKPTASYNVSFYKTKRTWKPLKGGYGARVGYYKFKSSGDSLPYVVNDGPGKATFTDYPVLMIGICTKWNYEFTDQLEGFFGLDVSYYYTSYEYTLNDPGQDVHGKNVEGKYTISPKIGLAFNLSEEFGLFIQTRYNLCLHMDEGSGGASNGISAGSSKDHVYNGQSNFGRAIHIWSNNFGIYYRFRT